MPFERFVETGRIAYITDGRYKGKICSIVDCIDQKSVLVDGPETKVPRQKLRLSQIHLTKFKINFPFNGPTRCVRQAWKKADLNNKWEKSRWAEKAANRKRRLELTDFERFKLKRVRRIRNKIRTEEYLKLLKRVYNPIAKSKRNLYHKKKVEAAKKKVVKPVKKEAKGGEKKKK